MKRINLLKICGVIKSIIGEKYLTICPKSQTAEIFVCYEAVNSDLVSNKYSNTPVNHEKFVAGNMFSCGVEYIGEIEAKLKRVNDLMFENCASNSELPMEYYNYWTFELPTIVSKLMCSNFEDSRVVPLVNNFLVNVLKYIINNPNYDVRAARYDASNYCYEYNSYDYCLYMVQGGKSVFNCKLNILNKILNNDM